MSTKFFPAVIMADNDSFHVQFLDISAAFSQGETFEHALEMAREVLDLTLEQLHQRGEDIPDPTPYGDVNLKLAEILNAKERKDIVSVQMIPGAIPGKAVRVMVSLEEELLRRIDNEAGHYGRSGFLAEAAREKLVRKMPSYGFAEESDEQDRARPTRKKHPPANRALVRDGDKWQPAVSSYLSVPLTVRMKNQVGGTRKRKG